MVQRRAGGSSKDCPPSCARPSPITRCSTRAPSCRTQPAGARLRSRRTCAPRYSINRPSNARVPPVNGSAPRFPRAGYFLALAFWASPCGSGPLRCLHTEVILQRVQDAHDRACKRLSGCCEIQGQSVGAPGPRGSPGKRQYAHIRVR